MINGAHIVVYSKDAEADCNFFRDVLRFSSVDAGHGWLIFGLPKTESAFHPAQTKDRHELYFMCDNLKTEIEALRAKGVADYAPNGRRYRHISLAFMLKIYMPLLPGSQ